MKDETWPAEDRGQDVGQTPYLDDAGAGLRLVLWVFQDFDWSVADDASSQEHLEHTETGELLHSSPVDPHLSSHASHLADQSWPPPVSDVILPHVPMQPITEVEETVVQ